MKYLPEPLYRFLPTLYVLAGGLVEILHPHGLGKASAFLLVLVGTAVFNLRLNHLENTHEARPDACRDCRAVQCH